MRFRHLKVHAGVSAQGLTDPLSAGARACGLGLAGVAALFGLNPEIAPDDFEEWQRTIFSVTAMVANARKPATVFFMSTPYARDTRRAKLSTARGLIPGQLFSSSELFCTDSHWQSALGER